MKDDGVSGVVGIILLLALVIIAASLVAAVAFGVSDSAKAVPSLSADVYFTNSGNQIIMILEHTGGEYVSCGDVKITAFMKLADGTERSGAFMLDSITTEPVWSAGILLKTSGTAQTAKCLGVTEQELKNAFARSTPVLIKIYHVPSSGILYQKNLLLENKK